MYKCREILKKSETELFKFEFSYLAQSGYVNML